MRSEIQKLDRLADLHRALGLLLAVGSMFAVVPMALAYSFLRQPGSLRLADGTPAPPGHAWFMIVAAAGLMVGGWVLAWALLRAARYLRERTHHRFCLVVAAVSCAFTPLGTILGVMTLAALTDARAKALFAPAAASPGPAYR